LKVVEVSGLVKVYSPSVVALNGVTFDLPSRGLHIVAGPNGAGKTTLLRILYTALLPTSGEARVLGFDVISEASRIRKHIAVVPQDAVPEPYLTPKEFVELYLIARGFSRSDAAREARIVLELLGLDHVKDRLCLVLSGGERRRVLVAAALATNANVLFLDEPTTGLDPAGRADVHAALRALVKEGHTVIMTTHLLNEAESIADLVVILNRGRVVAIGRPEDVKSSILRYSYRVVLRTPRPEIVNSLRPLGLNISTEGNTVLIYVDRSALGNVLTTLAGHGAEFSVEKVGLDDAFRMLVRRGASHG